MTYEVFEAGFVSTTILNLHKEVFKITGANQRPDLRSISIAIVLARALETIATLTLAAKVSLSSRQDENSAQRNIRAATLAITVREELADAIAALEYETTEVELRPVVVLMERAISALDILLGDRVAIERTDEDNAWPVTQIISLMMRVFGDAVSAANWLCAPSMGFCGQRPMDLLTSRHGAQMIVTHLTHQTNNRKP